MKASELLALIDAETAAFNACLAEKGVMAAFARRKDHAMLWASQAGITCPSIEYLRANADKDLTEIVSTRRVETSSN